MVKSILFDIRFQRSLVHFLFMGSSAPPIDEQKRIVDAARKWKVSLML